jgi:hypothetical protein
MQSTMVKTLTSNDTAVLQALFDPEASLSTKAKIEPFLSTTREAERVIALQEEERLALELVNQQNPAILDIELSISKLSQIIDSAPRYASAWNNRAQTTHMLHDANDESADHTTQIQSIITDLRTAITLATPTSPADSVSQPDAKVLASAHTHRGYLLWQASRSDSAARTLASVNDLKDLSRDDMEEMASRDFFLGGRYGNQIAQQLAVRANPYAKLRGSIAKEVMRKEISDHFQLYSDELHE